MARFEFKMPDIGEGVTEGEIVAWGDGVEVGARVEVDQTLAEVMTDKATVTIPSPKAGVIVELACKAGEVIAVGAVMLVIETEGAAAGAEPAKAKPESPKPVEPAKPAPESAEPAKPAQKSAEPAKPAPKSAEPTESAETKPEEDLEEPVSGPSATAAGSIPEELPGMGSRTAEGSSQRIGDKPLAAPATRKLARELGVKLEEVAGSGPHGRVTQEDVRKHGQGPSTSAQIVKATKPALDPVRIA
ncbi:MAG: biotin/lipoyl-containing protein, partial [Coriobacteriia bacterium]|nr:biotin/lipoyl-containing protein [Coriobacteriia bacterium]